jgi:peptidoglycan hydrolase CwlO-like protein
MKKVTEKTSQKSNSLTYHTILLEDIQHNVQLLAEGMMTLNEKIDDTNGSVKELKEKVTQIDTRLTSVELDMMEVKKDVKDIKGTMVRKADLKDPIKRIENLERVVLA